MKHFRCILLCLSLMAMLGLMVGCSCGNPKNETSANFSEESGSVGIKETHTQEPDTTGIMHESDTAGDMHESHTSGMMPESASSPSDIYETGDGMTHDTEGIGHETSHDGGLMEDVTDGLDRVGEDISDAVNDVTESARTRER